MLDFIGRLFGNRNEREVKKLQPIIDEINRYAEEFKALTDEELKGKTAEFKARIKDELRPIERRQEDIHRLLMGVIPADVAEGDGHSEPASEPGPVERRWDGDKFERVATDWLDRAARHAK